MWERGHLKLGKEGVKLLSKCEAAVRGWVALAFDVGEGLDVSPHLVGVVICQEPHYLP